MFTPAHWLVLLFVLDESLSALTPLASGLFAVGVAVAIAAATGQARDFYVPGILRNAALAVVLLGSVVLRRPLVGVVAETRRPLRGGRR